MKNNIIEKFSREDIKAFILIGLFILALILTSYKFNVFGDFLFAKGSPYNYTLSLEEGLQSTIKPSQIIIRFGGDKSTKILSGKQRYYQEMKILLKEVLTGMKEMTDITENEFETAKSFKALQLNYSSLNGKLLSRSFFLEKSLVDNLEDIRQILIPLINENYFYIKTDTKVYKIKTSLILTPSAIDDLENGNYLNYQSLGSLFAVKSPALVPTGNFNIKFEKYDTISGIDTDKSSKIAQEIFKTKYDFAARITETDGSEIYTYNYGQQVLKIQQNGYIHYMNEDVENKDTTMEEAAQAAMNFLKSIGTDLNSLYFAEAKSVKVGGKNSYLFRFSETMKDLRVLGSAESIGINIIVTGGSVYSYTATMRATLPYDLSRESTISGPLEVLNPSFNSLLKNKFNVADFNQLFDKITEIELIYYMDEKYVLTPCWRMTIDGKEYLFNAYTGEMEPYGLV